MFLGKYRLSVDGKGRVELPKAFREALANGLYITRGFDQNLLLMSETAFQQKYQIIAGLNLADPAVRLLHRLLFANAARLELDSSGRVSIPAELRYAANMEKELVLVGQGDYLEAWSPEAWEKQAALLAETETNNARFASLDLAMA